MYGVLGAYMFIGFFPPQVLSVLLYILIFYKAKKLNRNLNTPRRKMDYSATITFFLIFSRQPPVNNTNPNCKGCTLLVYSIKECRLCFGSFDLLCSFLIDSCRSLLYFTQQKCKGSFKEESKQEKVVIAKLNKKTGVFTAFTTYILASIERKITRYSWF